MFTGELPHQHGVHAGHPSFDSISIADTFIDQLDGYRTIGVSANPYANSDFAFDELFDEFVDIDPYSRYPDGIDIRRFIQRQIGDDENLHEFVSSNITNPKLYYRFIRDAIYHSNTTKSLGNGLLAGFDLAAQKLSFSKQFDYGAKIVERESKKRVADTDEPYFLFVNLMDAHTPLQHIREFDRSIHGVENTWICNTSRYNPWDIIRDIDNHEEYLENRRALYAAALNYLDRIVVRFINEIEELSDGETTFLITSDHGENLGYEDDDRLVMHKSSMTESVLHVPLCIVNSPHNYDESKPVSHLQLPALIDDILTGGDSFSQDQVVAAEVIGLNSLTDISEIDDYEYWNRMIRCVYNGNVKCVWDSLGNVSMYEIDFDQPCKQQLVDDEVTIPNWATDKFEVAIDEFKARVESNDMEDDIEADVKDRLRELGYV